LVFKVGLFLCFCSVLPPGLVANSSVPILMLRWIDFAIKELAGLSGIDAGHMFVYTKAGTVDSG
jgi:hypothetical protein